MIKLVYIYIYIYIYIYYTHTLIANPCDAWIS